MTKELFISLSKVPNSAVTYSGGTSKLSIRLNFGFDTLDTSFGMYRPPVAQRGEEAVVNWKSKDRPPWRTAWRMWEKE